ncbi:M28 family peptidase [Mariniblastus fucicola]|uniref:Aminopeptidase YwaD n=1 Tax=Mariniblastus fucicola TaxID=980251 RepID=A0A5B9PDP1_9BACT|nr:M28 family peptidase [Mariniblastus fucicola]QEG23609.1 Aminopeptidase YwaD precursor [Mariniblastus fucicola]
MRVISSTSIKPSSASPNVQPLLDRVDPVWLRDVVEAISKPRQWTAQREQNRETANYIETQLGDLGYNTFRQSPFDNIVTEFNRDKPVTIIGAHYDSVPQTPGADDNASAVAAMLGCAKAVAELSLPVCFVAFNLEEEGLEGSRSFVNDFIKKEDIDVDVCHVLEMVGYCDHTEGSQRLPKGLPVKLARSAGDFLAIIANRNSNHLLDSTVQTASTYASDLPVLGLKVFMGMEKIFKDLRRSDHAPFWDAGYPAFMWTDTSEFRNPHYHQPSDTPETLDYEFLAKVVKLLVAEVASKELSPQR